MIKIYPQTRSLDMMAQYVSDPEKRSTLDEELNRRLLSAVMCSPENFSERVYETAERHERPGGNLAYHLILYYSDRTLKPEKVHSLSKDFCDRAFHGEHPLILATHTDTLYCHSHILVGSVNDRTGFRLKSGREGREMLEKEYNLVCRENGFLYFRDSRKKEYRFDTFYVIMFEIMSEIDASLYKARNLNDIKRHLIRHGYRITDLPYEDYWVVHVPGVEKPVSLYHAGKEYSKLSLDKRIKTKEITVYPASLRRRYGNIRYSLPTRADRIERCTNDLYRRLLRFLSELGALPGYGFDIKKQPAGTLGTRIRTLLTLKQVIKRDGITKLGDFRKSIKRNLARKDEFKIIYPLYRGNEKLSRSLNSERTLLLNENRTLMIAEEIFEEIKGKTHEREVEMSR